ncbi:C39 family peptidase [Methanoregula sp.]|uniref:C39 family peptidase n=1 Tax=Methanoregula sp. TaxID=2052170 RepID=UPI0035680771
MHRSVPLFIIALALIAGLIVSAGCMQASVSPQDAGIQNATGSESVLSTVPDVRQSQPYSCGAACLLAIFNYWGIDMREGVLMQELNTTEEAGTSPDAIVRVARAHGLQAALRTNLTLADLERSLANRTPVIIDCQAWSDTSPANISWEDDWEDGHYMIVIGLDAENVYFEDPSQLGTRGVIPRQEFISRWHDYEGPAPFNANSTPMYHAGIFISGSKSANYPTFTHVD